uniref:non-specific serine/threonine protein kinase n=1 Tax=Denticeps clupeoides TaxID=299321 RepID=A0AAY3ZWY3_9TELE
QLEDTSSSHSVSIDFEELQMIGEGGYGKVYKAINRQNGQMSAVKVMNMDQMYDDNELEFMQNVNHHNITNLIEVYYWDKQLYVFMEICGGGSLWGLCYKTGGPLTEQEIAYVTKECLQGLHYMHVRGYMHRDFKLENILLTEAGKVKICDFGLVEKMESKTHEVTGTIMIRAPEVSVAEERGSYDERCDIWSLGISVLDLAECMSLLTYESDKIYQSWITNTKNNWSEDFKSFVRAALTVDPARRPTAEELLNHSFILSVQSGQGRLRRRLCRMRNNPKKLNVGHKTETVKKLCRAVLRTIKFTIKNSFLSAPVSIPQMQLFFSSTAERLCLEGLLCPHLIGEGGYGQVYKAINQHNGQIAAVKVIKMDQMYDDNELEFMQNVNHHNVTNLIEIYYWDKQLYVFMEICGGGSLFGLCYKTGPLTEQEIAYVTTECLQGLHNMHLRGYMHRDIKLKNILLTDAGEVKICDFGLVEKMENKTHEVVGTVMIRAPEVSMAEERGSYDERCDIWSLGISLLYLAESMSHLTFESDTIYQIWITNTKNNWSEDFKSFVRAALIVDPARRPTAEEEQKRLRTSYKTVQQRVDKSAPYDGLLFHLSSCKRNKQGLRLRTLPRLRRTNQPWLRVRRTSRSRLSSTSGPARRPPAPKEQIPPTGPATSLSVSRRLLKQRAASQFLHVHLFLLCQKPPPSKKNKLTNS